MEDLGRLDVSVIILALVARIGPSEISFGILFRASHLTDQEAAAERTERHETGAIPLDGFLIMLNSFSNKRAAKIERALIEAHQKKAIAAALSGELAPQRAALVLSLIAGFQVMRQMIGLSALAEADLKTPVRILQPVLQQLVEGNQTRGTKPPRKTE
jgi:Tetracyclin repressor-like, C-terminal domain